MVKGHGQDTVCCIHAHEIFVLKMGSTNNVLYLLYIAFIVVIIENYYFLSVDKTLQHIYRNMFLLIRKLI